MSKWSTRFANLRDAIAAERATPEPVDAASLAGARLLIDATTALGIVVGAWYNSFVALLAVFLLRVLAQHGLPDAHKLVARYTRDLSPALDVLARATKRAVFTWHGDVAPDGRCALAEQWAALEKRINDGGMTTIQDGDWNLHGVVLARLHYSGYAVSSATHRNKCVPRFTRTTGPTGAWRDAVYALFTMMDTAARHEEVGVCLFLATLMSTMILLAKLTQPFASINDLGSACIPVTLAACTVGVFLLDVARALSVVVPFIFDQIETRQPSEKVIVLHASVRDAIASCEGKQHVVVDELRLDASLHQEFTREMTVRGYRAIDAHCRHASACLQLDTQ